MQHSNKSSGKNINLLKQSLEKNDPNLFLTKLPLKKQKEKSQNSTNFTKNGNISNSEKDEKNNNSSLLSYMNEINKNIEQKSYISKKMNEEHLNSLCFYEHKITNGKSSNTIYKNKNNNLNKNNQKSQISKSQKPKQKKMSSNNKIDSSLENQNSKAKNDDTERLKTNVKSSKGNSENTKFLEESSKFDKNPNIEKLFKPQTDKIYEKIKSLKYTESETDNNSIEKDSESLKRNTLTFLNDLLNPTRSLHENEFKNKNPNQKSNKNQKSPNKSNYDSLNKNVSKETNNCGALSKNNIREIPIEILKKSSIINENQKKKVLSQIPNAEINSNEKLSQFFDKMSKNKNNNYLIRFFDRKTSTPINSNPCLLSVRNPNDYNYSLNMSEILVRVKKTLSKYKLNQDFLIKERNNMINELQGLRKKIEFYERNDLQNKTKNNK